MTTTDNKNNALATLKNSTGWTQWRKKAKAHFLGKGLWETLTSPRPSEHNLVIMTETEKEDWRARRRIEVLAERPTGAEDLEVDDDELGPVPTSRLETGIELQKRQLDYDVKNTLIWSDLVKACTHEAFNIIDESPDQDGKAAFELLVKHYGSASANSQFMSIKAMFRMRQSGGITKHVGEFKSQMRKLADMKVRFDPKVEAVMFLDSLKKPEFDTFVANAMMNSNMLVETLYTAAIEHAKAHLAKSDEAKNTKLAMAVTETCKFGAGCRKWTQGRCNKFHPAPNSSSSSRGTKRPRSNEQQEDRPQSGWTCETCEFYNFGYRKNCLHCKTKLGEVNRNWKESKKHQKKKYRARRAREAAAMDMRDSSGSDSDSEDGQPIDEAMMARERLHDTALEAKQDKKRIKFTVDSGATAHFVNRHVPLVHTKPYDSTVLAAGGKSYDLTETGNCVGKATNGAEIAFKAKRCDAFKHNLFSVFEAARKGTRTVFDWDNSYLESKTTGKRVPLQRTESGWTLEVKPDARAL